MLYRHVLDKRFLTNFAAPRPREISEPWQLFFGPCLKSHLSHKFDRPETVSDRVKIILAGHRV